jgi:hypothetical protein
VSGQNAGQSADWASPSAVGLASGRDAVPLPPRLAGTIHTDREETAVSRTSAFPFALFEVPADAKRTTMRIESGCPSSRLSQTTYRQRQSGLTRSVQGDMPFRVWFSRPNDDEISGVMGTISGTIARSGAIQFRSIAPQVVVLH